MRTGSVIENIEVLRWSLMLMPRRTTSSRMRDWAILSACVLACLRPGEEHQEQGWTARAPFIAPDRVVVAKGVGQSLDVDTKPIRRAIKEVRQQARQAEGGWLLSRCRWLRSVQPNWINWNYWIRFPLPLPNGERSISTPPSAISWASSKR